MGFVAMMLMDLNDIWDEIMSYKQRIENLETLIMLHNNVISKVGCGVGCRSPIDCQIASYCYVIAEGSF